MSAWMLCAYTLSAGEASLLNKNIMIALGCLVTMQWVSTLCIQRTGRLPCIARERFSGWAALVANTVDADTAHADIYVVCFIVVCACASHHDIQ